jgi:nucleoside diphosphate kinase
LDTYLVKAMIVGKKPVVVQVKKLAEQHPAKMAPGNEIRMAFNKLATH